MRTPTDISTLLNTCNKRLAYNPNTGLFTWKWHYNKSKIGSLAGCNSHNYKAVSMIIEGNRNNYLLHRIAFLIMKEYWPKYIDHVNRDGKDNRWCNIRECTGAQNNANIPAHKRSRTQLKGVFLSGKKYLTKITNNGVNIHIGTFTCKYDAAEAYNKKAFELHKEFAWLNPIPLHRNCSC